MGIMEWPVVYYITNYFVILQVGLRKLEIVNCLADKQVGFQTAVRGKCLLSVMECRINVRYAVISGLHLNYLMISDDLTS